ncbi:MAG: glycosyltransferase family 4 protein [Deltaproteobacteria bacterium]|nr:glycosyltransferase family 4 protein [Deltaproteobacteria bacterium]
MSIRFGFVSTRFSGTDGVSLESFKWAEVLENAGHTCYWFAGELEREPESSFLMPEAHFLHPKIEWINQNVMGRPNRKPAITEMIHELRAKIKANLYQFIHQFNIDILVVQNALTIPMNVPLGLALAETISESQIPTIAHHHDFAWERDRYAVNGIGEYIQMAFPPKLPTVAHVVINSSAREELAHRSGVSSTYIPNMMDFENPPLRHKITNGFRQINGLGPDDIVILQPTRVVQRKGIEHAIEVVKQLKIENCKLLVSHEAGDEGFEYHGWLIQRARQEGVDLRFVETDLSGHFDRISGGDKRFSLWDAYRHADFVTFPSLCEGFGNALLEAVYFQKPVMVNRYSTYIRDIEPLGFDFVTMDGIVTQSTVESVREILTDSDRRRKICRHNYQVAAKHFSYRVLRNRLEEILSHLTGERICLDSDNLLPMRNVVHLNPPVRSAALAP